MTNDVPTPKKKQAPKKYMTKTALRKALADKCSCNVKVVNDFLQALEEICVSELQAGRDFSLPNIVKIKIKTKPATPAVTKMDPFKKIMRDYPAKPAKKIVKSIPLKSIKNAMS